MKILHGEPTVETKEFGMRWIPYDDLVDVDLDEILADFIEAGCDGSRPNSFTKYLKGQLEVKHDAIE